VRNARKYMVTSEEASDLKKNCEALKNLCHPPVFHYGWFFDTSGYARVEQINPKVSRTYLFRTDHHEQTDPKSIPN